MIMIRISACMAAFAMVMIAMAGLATSSAVSPVDGVGDAIGQMRVSCFFSRSRTSSGTNQDHDSNLMSRAGGVDESHGK